MENPTARWILELVTKCPNCEENVDLLAYQDCWDGRTLRACEHDTDQSKDVEVVCPDCSHEFLVDLIW